MAFCKFSSEYVSNNSVQLDNRFINEFLPSAPENCTKVYLLGLYKCNNADQSDNNVESFARVLNLSEDDVISCFYYWQEVGLVQIINSNPLEVRYLPVKDGSLKLRHFNKDKYKAFNIKAQELLEGRMITPLEFQEYYYLIESLHMESDALLMVIKYCTEIKGNNVGYKYILTVAKNWAYEGLTTCEDVEERLKEQEKNSSDVSLVLKALKINRKPTVEEYQMYLEWINTLKINLDVVMYLAKNTAKGLGGFNKLNYLVNKVFMHGLNSVKEVSEYFENEKVLFELAKQTNKALGLRNIALENVVEGYLSYWVKMGFDSETILYICNLAFNKNLRNYPEVEALVNKFYQSGLITLNEIKGYVKEQEKYDEKISKYLDALGIFRRVNDVDRSFYFTWVNEWNLNEELISYAISQAKGASMPLREANRILSQYFQRNIKTVEEAKNIKIEYKTSSVIKENAKKPLSRKYSPQEIEQGYDNIFEVEV